ncbi:hypothetical protein BDR07DRAFT_1431130 [Suillus spraguei]|nr:hypothetical protein BDR07DRAFT_1440212 [Suillus spraguei]KAG2354001.1 hypothetical protein BDR07DRAFT_1431130 [Suillus spraguei]
MRCSSFRFIALCSDSAVFSTILAHEFGSPVVNGILNWSGESGIGACAGTILCILCSFSCDISYKTQTRKSTYWSDRRWTRKAIRRLGAMMNYRLIPQAIRRGCRTRICGLISSLHLYGISCIQEFMI